MTKSQQQRHVASYFENESEEQEGDAKATFDHVLAQLPVLDEARKHLGFHEEVQEVAHVAGAVGFAEGLPLEHPLPLLCDAHVQGVVPHNLHEELHKSLGDQGVQGHVTCGEDICHFGHSSPKGGAAFLETSVTFCTGCLRLGDSR